ncbi:general substrate transporter [Thozetella sp. PMI_491]|nr:general substrate transporter [Thozetella sp. PMI_491]
MTSGVRGFAQDVSVYLLVLIAITTLGPLQFGFHLAELNAPHKVITCEKDSIPTVASLLKNALGSKKANAAALADCIPMTEAAFASISSVFTIGGLIGALAAGPVTSARGRLLAMRLTAAFFVLGSLIETVATSVPTIGFGRLLSGVGAGATTVVVPLYISEVAPPAERGFFGAFTQISINVGILITQTMGFFLSHGSAWRWVLGAGVFLAAAQFLGLFLVPESPAWIATVKGDVTSARRTIQRIRGQKANVDDEVASWGAVKTPGGEEQALLDEQTPEDVPPALSSPVSARPPLSRLDSGARLGFFEVLKDSRTRPAIFAVVGIQLAQQLCGINSVIMYSVSLLEGLLPFSSAKLAIFISVANLAMTVACSPLPDKLGRKTCLLISIIGQGSSSLALALSIMYGFKITSAASVVLFVVFFAVGLGPVPFIMASELVGQEAVGATQSWSLGANYAATFVVAQFFPIVNEELNRRLGGAGWVYFIFAGLAAVFALFVSWHLPETNGKKDADEVWGRTRRLD